MKLLSGGQSGVDRAVLDVALARGLDYRGWCPKGGWAEDFTAPPGLLAKYPHLKETPLADPAQRTEWNVRDAQACMIIVDAGGVDVSAGTALARDLAHRYRKPLLLADLGNPQMVKHATLWLRVQECLARADPRPEALCGSGARGRPRALFPPRLPRRRRQPGSSKRPRRGHSIPCAAPDRRAASLLDADI